MNDAVCWTCKQEAAGDSREFSFGYRGFVFKTHKSRSECAGCAQKKMQEKFDDEEITGLVSLKNGQTRVDWDFYCHYLWQRSRIGDDGKLSRILLALDVFSFAQPGNWEILCNKGSAILNMNPHMHNLKLYFTCQQDAVQFACRRYGGCQDDWYIAKAGSLGLVARLEAMRMNVAYLATQVKEEVS